MRNKRLYSLAVATLAIFFACSTLFAQGWAPNAKRLFENDEYKKVIDLLEKGAKDNFAFMFLAFSHLQENVFSKTKWDAEKYKNYKYQLEAKLNVNDINNLLYFVNLNDKPHVVKEARKLVKKTFDNVKAIEDVPKLLAFLSSSDKDSRKLALAQIKEILEPKRKYVNEGGTMRAQDVQIMNSKNLITALLENVAEGDARKALEIIEEPSLQFTPSYPGIETTKLEASINGLMAKRKKKFPDSNWYSATGKTR